MTPRQGSRRAGRWTTLALALYALFLVTAQFEHHDLACHFKTPQHCTACGSSQLGSDPHTPAGLERCRLADAGRPVVVLLQLEGALLSSSASGRSPPSLS